MAESHSVAVRVAEGLRRILARLGSLALGVAEVAAVIGLATFATGWWVFGGSRSTWIIVGGALCIAPSLAAVIAWWRVRRTVRVAPDLVSDVKSLMHQSQGAAEVLITYDAGDRFDHDRPGLRPVGSIFATGGARSCRRAGVRAITTLPGLVAIALLGTLCVGALGTILLIGGLID